MPRFIKLTHFEIEDTELNLVWVLDEITKNCSDSDQVLSFFEKNQLYRLPNLLEFKSFISNKFKYKFLRQELPYFRILLQKYWLNNTEYLFDLYSDKLVQAKYGIIWPVYKKYKI